MAPSHQEAMMVAEGVVGATIRWQTPTMTECWTPGGLSCRPMTPVQTTSMRMTGWARASVVQTVPDLTTPASTFNVTWATRSIR